MASTLLSECLFRRRGSLCGRIVASTLLRERPFRRRGSRCGRIVVSTLLHERPFRRRSSRCGRIVASTLLREQSFCQCGSPCGCIVASTLLSEATALLDEHRVCCRVVSLAAATIVGQQVPETLHISPVATAVVVRCRRPSALVDSGCGQPCRACCGRRETLLRSQRGAMGANLLVSQACESGLTQLSPGGLAVKSGVEAASAKP